MPPTTVAQKAPLFMEFSRPEYWCGQLFPSPGNLANPGIEPRSPTLQADSLPAKPLGKPKNTVVGSLSLLQRIFLTQESNLGLLHCRWILYQLSHQGNLGSRFSPGPLSAIPRGLLPLQPCTLSGHAQLCPTLGDLMDNTVHGILQARMLEWAAFPT